MENSLKGRINALCNAKRAIENRVDFLITSNGLRYFAKKYRWNFPDKMNKLLDIEIKIPNVLQSMITSKRNFLEHEYIVPKNKGEIEDAIDIAELFLDASEKYLRDNEGFLWMANRPPDAPHMPGSDAKFVIIFDFIDNSEISFYYKDVSQVIKISDMKEDEMRNLIKIIRTSHPTIRTTEKREKWDIDGYKKAAEKMVNKYNIERERNENE